MANIIVTGAAGFIGSHTVDQLLRSGHQVWGVDDFRTGRVENLSEAIQNGLRFREFSVLDFSKLKKLIHDAKPDAVIHLAALVSVAESIKRPDLNYRLNLEATYLLAEAARLYGVRRLVYASSAAVYGDAKKLPISEDSKLQPISPYGAAKQASECLLLSYATAYGMTARIQRYFNVYGPRQDPNSPYSGVISIFIKKFLSQQTMTFYGDGEQTRDFINVFDVARANVLAATRVKVKTGVANICTGQATSLQQIQKELVKFAPEKALPPCYLSARPGDIRHSIGMATEALDAFGFKARKTLSIGLRELIQLRI